MNDLGPHTEQESWREGLERCADTLLIFFFPCWHQGKKNETRTFRQICQTSLEVLLLRLCSRWDWSQWATEAALSWSGLFLVTINVGRLAPHGGLLRQQSCKRLLKQDCPPSVTTVKPPISVKSPVKLPSFTLWMWHFTADIMVLKSSQRLLKSIRGQMEQMNLQQIMTQPSQVLSAYESKSSW